MTPAALLPTPLAPASAGPSPLLCGCRMVFRAATARRSTPSARPAGAPRERAAGITAEQITAMGREVPGALLTS